MENQPKLANSKEVISYLAEKFPLCFVLQGEAKPLKIGIFKDIIARLQDDPIVSKTQLRTALRLYTSSWRYLYGLKEGAKRIDLDGNTCGEIEQSHIEFARTQLKESKALLKQTKSVSEESKTRKRVRPQQGDASSTALSSSAAKPDIKKKRSASTNKKDSFVQRNSASAPKPATTKHANMLPIELSTLKQGQTIKVNIGRSLSDAIVLEVMKESVRAQLPSGLAVVLKSDHIKR